MRCAILAAVPAIPACVLWLLWRHWLVSGHHSIEELTDKAKRIDLIVVLPGRETK